MLFWVIYDTKVYRSSEISDKFYFESLLILHRNIIAHRERQLVIFRTL